MSVSEWDVCPHCGGNGDDPDRCDEYCDQGCCPACQGLGRVPPDNVVEAAAKVIDGQMYDHIDDSSWVMVTDVAKRALVAAALEEHKDLRSEGETRCQRCGLDEHDRALYSEAFRMAEAVRLFLARNTTQRIIDADLLDDDVVAPLIESADRMWSIRTQRVGAARAAALEEQNDATV